MASLMRSAVGSPVEVPKRFEALASQYSHTARAAYEMGHSDSGAAIEGGVDGTET